MSSEIELMVMRTASEGALAVSEFVTDGYETWLETIRYYGYPQNVCRSLFMEHLRRQGWSVAQ
jgi:hypothetical protein